MHRIPDDPARTLDRIIYEMRLQLIEAKKQALDKPLIDPRYLSDRGDLDLTVKGLRKASEIAKMPAFAAIGAREILPGPHGRSDETLIDHIRRTANTVYHPAGTCRMGAADDPRSVVDPCLRVRGIGRLRVADASIFPTMIGVNPCITCMMIGEKCADLIRERP